MGLILGKKPHPLKGDNLMMHLGLQVMSDLLAVVSTLHFPQSHGLTAFTDFTSHIQFI